MATELPNDPLESLRQPVVPIAPRAAFASVLRNRLEESLGMNTSTTTETVTEPTATDERAIGFIPYLCVAGADRALAFYAEAFGGVETTRLTDEDGRVGHAEMSIHGVQLMLSDEHPEMGILGPTSLGGSPVLLYLQVADVDAVFASAVAAGAIVEREPADQFHGNRTASVRDPFGHRWMLSAPSESLSDAEFAARAAADGYETKAATSTPRRPVSQLGYWTFRAPDVDRAARFYGELFGWAFDPAEPGGERAYRHVSNTDVPMGVHDDPTLPPQNLYYRVGDLAAMTARVRELGGEVLEVTDHPSGGNARCRDDQGVEFELWKPAPGYE
jgi:uncharacterized glyoxalase superfamily protein PhnB